MRLSFRKWLENLTDPNAIADPQQMAQHWKNNLPGDNSMKNEAGIKKFADDMSAACSGKPGGENLAHHISKYETPVLAYDEPIANNLINSDDERLREARGFITEQEDPEFSFYMQGDRAGSLLIQHPPVVYDESDKILIGKVIAHEVGHAIDWLDPNYHYVPPSGRYILNAEKYAENIHEARRLSEMLASLLREVGSFNKTMDMLQKPGPFVLPPALAPVAAQFLFTFAKEHSIKMESWQSWAAPLLMSAGATWAAQPAQAPTTPTQPAHQMVQQVDNKAEAAKTAANLVKRIVKLMQLSNFVEYKGK